MYPTRRRHSTDHDRNSSRAWRRSLDRCDAIRHASRLLRPVLYRLAERADTGAARARSACPVGPYYSTGFKPVKLLATTKDVRAWPGGTGGYKLGSNYAAGVVPQQQAAALGYQQILWLYGDDHQLTEVGTMNLFVCLEHKDGTIEMVTPPLGDMILPGVTRDSVLSLAKDHASGANKLKGMPAKFKVSERNLTSESEISAC